MFRFPGPFRWILPVIAWCPLQVWADVRVEVAAPQIERRTYDPDHPSPEMPKLTPPEVGTCVFKFDCAMETQASGSGRRSARVTDASIRAGLSITIWTPIAGPGRVLGHEEGHRKICEIYYRPARDIGERIAWAALDAPLRPAGRAGLERQLDAIQKRSIAAFLRETATRCEYAQERFDAITDHSMNPVPENVAIAQSILQERAHYASTRDATGSGTAAQAIRPGAEQSAE